MNRSEDVARIRHALEAARQVLSAYTPGAVTAESKAGGSPVTEADLRVDETLAELLPHEGEGWLSEESEDDLARLACERVWIVDPIDGTKEFVAGRPEWCVSIGLVERGVPVAGGLLNPMSDELILGAPGLGVTLNGSDVRASDRRVLRGAHVLASRTEMRRGRWDRWSGACLDVEPIGSVAWKLGLVAAGRADATWTLTPKNEWDVAAGVALVVAAGGRACLPDGRPAPFNRPDPALPGLLAAAPGLADLALALVADD